jgi:hypothetical protein
MQKMRLEYDVDVWDYKEDMIPLLKELWRMADLNNFHEETVMLFYLIGAFWYFWWGKCPWLFDAAISPIMSLEDFRRYWSKRKSAGVLLYGHDKKQV